MMIPDHQHVAENHEASKNGRESPFAHRASGKLFDQSLQAWDPCQGLSSKDVATDILAKNHETRSRIDGYTSRMHQIKVTI